MLKKKENAWVTGAIDEETTLQAIVLAKSLSRVVTAAATVALIPEDFPNHLGALLSRFFDYMVIVNLGERKYTTKLEKMEILVMSSWNLTMYAKCVVLYSNKMVMKNCDELFGANGPLTAALIGKKELLDITVMSIKPDFKDYKRITTLAINNKFESLSDLLSTYFDHEEIGRLLPEYNYNIMRTCTEEVNLPEVRIATLGNQGTFLLQASVYKENRFKQNDDFSSMTMALLNFWLSSWNETVNEMKRFEISSKEFLPKVSLTREKGRYKDAIAIIGQSCRFPAANNSAEFWKLMKEGADGIRTVPLERLLDFQLNDIRFTESKAGFLKCPIDEFDAEFFGIGSKEAGFMDPQQRLLMEVAWEALENAAINPQTLKGSNTGVFTGIWTHDYERLINENASAEDFQNIILGNSFSATSSRVSHFLDLRGPNVATESGCSSSMVALHLACDSLRKRESDVGLVLGANIIVVQLPLAEISILARDGHCKTFDESADGFGRAEGVAVLVLKRLSDAIKCGDRILAVILGTAMSNEGTTSNFGTPSKLCQEIAIKDALQNAGVEPGDIDFVEAHGTGTPIGDPVEFAALSAGYSGQRKKPLIIGSVKTNIGHTESTAGLAGLIKVLLAFEHEMIPAHVNFKNLNSNIDLNLVPAVIPLEPQNWSKNSERSRIAGVSSFGISGTNVHVILEEPPSVKMPFTLGGEHEQEIPLHIVTLSAKSENALKDLSNSYVNYLIANPDVNIADLSYTCNNGRAHLEYRLGIIGKNTAEFQEALGNSSFIPPVLNKKPKIAFLFSGDGSQNIGMAKSLFKSNFEFRRAFNECATIIHEHIGISIKDVLWAENAGNLVDNTVNSQLSIFSVQYGLLKLWESLGVLPNFVLGYGLGEFAAATAAGIIDLKDSLLLVAEKCRLLQNLPPGGQDHISASIEKFAKNISYKPSKYQYVSGTTGTLLSEKELADCNYWLKHAREPVKFQKGIDCLKKLGCNVFIEIGPHPVLLPLGMSKFDKTTALWLPSLRNDLEDRQTILNSIKELYINGGNINWSKLDNRSNRKKLQLPTYPFQRQKYWMDLPSDALQKPVHPLLGRQVPLADLAETIYENKLTLVDHSFLKDHQVSNIIILPGAGFLEIILAAGKDILMKNQKKDSLFVTVSDFVVEAPFQLEEGKKYKIQVVAHPIKDKPRNFHIKVYLFRKLNGYNNERGWKTYSSAYVTFRDSIGCSLDDKQGETNLDSGSNFKNEKGEYIAEDIETIKGRCPVEKESSEFYKLAPEIGIFFGETFQSIETVWAGANEAVALIPAPVNAGNLKDYVYHPIVLDAMIQLFGLSIGQDNVDLYLPVGIDYVFMVRDTLSEVLFAHAKWTEESTVGTVALYNNKNELLVLMVGVRLMRTSISSFLNVISAYKHMLPGMYQEIWRQRIGPLQARIDVSKIVDTKQCLEPLIETMEKHMHMFDLDCQRKADEAVSCGIMRILMANGFFPKVGVTYWMEEYIQDQLLLESHLMLLKRIFEILCEDGYGVEIKSRSGFMDGWMCIKEFPSFEELSIKEKYVDKCIYIKGAPIGRTIIADILHKCMEHEWEVMQGKKTAVSALFGRNDLNPLDVYTKSHECVVASMRLGNYIGLALKEFKSSGNQDDAIVRILEIGAGSGATTKEVITVLQREEIPFRYTFTDISPHFFEGAKEQFLGISGLDYKVLDIEKDPSNQGFCPNYYDVVIAANVIHATENLRTSVTNIRKLISTDGILLLQEIIDPSRPIDIIFGILEGYWKFTDFDVRPRHSMASNEVWSKVLLETGFTESTNVSSKDEFIAVLASRAVDMNSNGKGESEIGHVDEQCKATAWVMFCEEEAEHLSETLERKLGPICDAVLLFKKGMIPGKAQNENMFYFDQSVDGHLKALIVDVLEKYDVKGLIFLATNVNDDNKEFCYKAALSVCQTMSNTIHQNLQFFVITKGVYSLPNQKTIRPLNAVIWGMAKSLGNEAPKLQGKMIDLDPDISDVVVESEQIFFEIFDKEEMLICYRNLKKYVPRFIKLPKALAPLTLPKGRYVIDIPKSKKINDVSFSALEKQPLGPKNVEVIVKAVALNFRDIFVILKPDMYTTMRETVGSDFSGIVSNVGSEVTKFNIGDEIYGIALSSSVGSHAVTHEDIILPKPKEITFTDAATVPSVLLTAFYCLVTVANVQKNESILIHVASGGVGLIAIQIANWIGAKIIATAGSHRKRSYLRSLGIEHVFHSRDLTYGDEIARVTNGRGVDMVLNSLTGNGFKETTLKICAKNARFVEIGKVNIWKPDEVYELRPDVQYTIIDLEKLTYAEMGDLLEQMKQHSNPNQAYKSLPYTRFDVVNIRDALNYFLKANHIGKIVLSMPEINEAGNQASIKDTVFNKNATYLVTGGLGGIGLEVAKWMTDSGCKNLILVGRTVPSNPVLQVLNNLRAKGCKIFTFQVDVGNWEQCKSLFQTIASSEYRLPPLRGVIHSAGVICDAIYMNQTWEKYEMVFNAKLNGTMNLHNLTKDLNLEHFVLFSSMAGLVGPMGQSNHSAANAFMDSFAHYRHSIGLPAQTINWGGWAEVGAASNTAYGKEGLFGVKPFTPNQGIATLKFIMNRPDLLHVGVVQVEIDEFKHHFSLGNVLSELVDDKENADIVPSSVQSEKFWAEIGHLSLEERNVYIKTKLTALIRQTLKLPDSEPIDEFQTFQEMGLDSLMAVEMKNKLQNIIGKKITLNVAAMMDYPTINSLSKYLAEQTMTAEIEGNPKEGNVTSNNAEFDMDGMYELIKQDCILPKDIHGVDLSSIVKPSEVVNILLTGSTGHLGIYLLKELVQNKRLHICCLIRAKTADQARRKLIANLKKYELFTFVDVDRISIVIGDIVEDNLGIPLEEYDKLSANTHMVFHLAAKAHHVERYKTNMANKKDIRSVNVLGTLNILKFACNIKTKRVLYTSSFSTVNRFTEDDFIYEEFPDEENNGEDITLGYSLSKFVCEKLIKESVDRGIPCVLIRYSSLLGSSESGRFTVDTNSTMNSFFLSLRLGVIPDIDGGWFGIPVDVASKLTLEIAFNDNVHSDVFNLVQPVPMHMFDFVAAAEQFGYKLTIVSMREYEELLRKETETNSFLTIFTDGYGGKAVYTDLSKIHPALRRFAEKKTNINRISEKFLKLIPDAKQRIPLGQKIFPLYMEFAIRSGLFERFGIAPTKSLHA